MAMGTPFLSRTAPLCTSVRWKQWSGDFLANAYGFPRPRAETQRYGLMYENVRPSSSAATRSLPSHHYTDEELSNTATVNSSGHGPEGPSE